MPTPQGIHWSFTLQFEETPPSICWDVNTQYAIWQHEKVGHDHLQGYVQVIDKHTTLHRMKVLIPGAHFERVTINKSGRKPWEYASKEETRVAGPWEYGIRIDKGSNKRSKIEACERSPERMSVEETDLFRMYQSHKKQKQFIEEYIAPPLDRKWQLELSGLLEQPADDRSVIWVLGTAGGEGKTTYAKNLVQKGYAYVDPNKYADMFEMYHQQGTSKHVVCDFHRSCDVDAFYGFIEKVKNRVIPKIKYRSSLHIELNNIHVVIMSNVSPNYEKISRDRIIMINASKEKLITGCPILMPYCSPCGKVAVGTIFPNGNEVVSIEKSDTGVFLLIKVKKSGRTTRIWRSEEEDLSDLFR